MALKANTMEPYIESAQQADMDHIPGTEYLKDSTDSDVEHLSGKDLIFFPRPSNDAADPLNWSAWRKGVAGATMALYSFLGTTATSSVAPMFPLLAETFHLTPTQVPLITGVSVMVLGFSNFIVIPFSHIYGRRAAALVFGVMFLACSIWQAVATSYGSFLAARAVVGIAASPSETLMVQVVADLFFIHERGLWMGVYFVSFCLGAFIGPVISGNIAQRHGWRSFFWLSCAMVGLNMVLIILFFPETKYNRQQPAPALTTASSSSIARPGSKAETTHHLEDNHDDALVGKGRPNRSQYRIFQKPSPQWKAIIIRSLIAPFRISLYPIVIFACLNLMGTANLTLFWNITESAILSAPPYNFSTSQVGFANFGFAAGSLIGVSAAGPFSDWVVKRAILRNKGVREAEMRLPALMPFGIATIVGIIIGGFAARDTWPWPVLVIIAYGTAGLSLAIPSIAIAYAVDCYKPISGEIMVFGTVVKNTTGFGMTYWLAPMVAKYSYMTPLMVWFTFTAGPILLTIPLYFWGKSLRRATKNSNLHTFEEMI